ncbi:MAG: prolipoprotein diacylglyceryl transferase [Candidatus Anammoxibacter sp.]
MHPTLFKIPIPFTDRIIPVHSYGFMMAVGFFLTIYVARRLAKKEGIDPDVISDLGIYIICSGIIGARIFFVIQNIGAYKGNFIDVFKVYEGGLVFYGGLIAAAGTFIVVARRKKLPLLKTMDVIFLASVLGLAFGRIGCFLNGCCYGDVTNPHFFCAVKFPRIIDGAGRVNGSPVFLHHYDQGLVSLSDSFSLPVHPTQIYAFCGCLAIFFLLNAFREYRKRDGEVVLLFGIIYSVYRFCIEFLRDDNLPLFDSLTISQNVSIVIFVVSLAAFAKFRKVKSKIKD